MNPFMASLIFIIISYFLGLLKQIFFPSSTIPLGSTNDNKIIQLQKVLDLSPNQPTDTVTAKPFTSLYEAYYHQQLYNRSDWNQNRQQLNQKFNHSILQDALQNQKQQYMCGSSYMLMIWRGLRYNQNGNAQWINLIQNYQLPEMKKKDQLVLFGRMILSDQCKMQKIDGRYHFGVVNQNRPILIKLRQNGKLFLESNFLLYVDQYFTEISLFDFSNDYWAYASKEQPWIVKVAEFNDRGTNRDISLKNKNKINFVQTNAFIQIDMLDLQLSKTNKFDQANHILNIRHIFITYQNDLYLTCIYDYLNTKNKAKKIVLATFSIQKQNMRLLSHIQLYSQKADGRKLQTSCTQFITNSSMNQASVASVNNQQFDLSCVISIKKKQQVIFLNVQDIFNYKKLFGKRTKKVKDIQNDVDCDADNQKEEEDPFNHSYEEDLLFMLKKMTPLVKKQPKTQQDKTKILSLKSFVLPQEYTEVQLLKPSLPDPIILLKNNNKNYLFVIVFPLSLNTPKKLSQQTSDSQISFESSIFQIKKSKKKNNKYTNIASQNTQKIPKEQQNQNIRYIQFIQENIQQLCKNQNNNPEKELYCENYGGDNAKLYKKNQLIVIFWQNSLEVYRYRRISEILQNNQISGISMTVMIPFIQLFATVFCMFHTVLGSST